MGSGLVSLIYKKTGETVKTLPYPEKARRHTIIDNWERQYGASKIWIQIAPNTNEKLINARGQNCFKVSESSKDYADEPIKKRQRPKAEYSNRNPWSILDEK